MENDLIAEIGCFFDADVSEVVTYDECDDTITIPADMLKLIMTLANGYTAP